MTHQIHRLGLAITCLVALGCGSETERLVPADDPDFSQFEAPEAAGECADTSDCEHSCVHSCIALNARPSTCPTIPTDTPTRVVGAACGCVATRCIWE